MGSSLAIDWEDVNMLENTNTAKLVVGYDLGETNVCISYCILKTSREMQENPESDVIETISAVAGTENYQIPMVLWKRKQTNQWYYGMEALRYAKEEEGVLIKNLLQLAEKGELLQIEGESCNPAALLALFMKRSLGLVTAEAGIEKIDALMISCEKMNRQMIEMFSQITNKLNLKQKLIAFQSYEEGFYHYMVHQPQELWGYKAAICYYRKDAVLVYQMDYRKNTTPITVFLKKEEYSFLKKALEKETQLDRKKRLDKQFLEITNQFCENNLISSVFLTGNWNPQEWMDDSLRFLCRGRRVFQGTNLYSKGACLGMLERISPSKLGRKYLFLGDDKLKVNIGMKALCQGEDTYYALIDAGVNWFEAESTCEFYLEEDKTVELMITPLIGRQGRLVQITLEGLSSSISRMRMHLVLPQENLLKVEILDLGFGEFISSTGRSWEEEIEI